MSGRWPCKDRDSDALVAALQPNPLASLRHNYWSTALLRALDQPRTDVVDFLDELEDAREHATDQLEYLSSIVMAAVQALDEDADEETRMRVAQAIADATGLDEVLNRARGWNFASQYPLLEAQLAGLSDESLALLANTEREDDK